VDQFYYHLRSIMDIKLKALLCAVACLATSPTLSFASGSPALTPGVVGADETSFTPPASDPPGFIEASFEVGKSYSCNAPGRLASDGVNFQTQIENVADASKVTGVLNGKTTPEIAGANDTTGGRLSFSVPLTATGGLYKVMFNSIDESGDSVRITCLETTLYGGYNTNASPLNFLEVNNTANAAIVAVVRARDTAGNIVFEGGATIAANGRADFDIHSQVGENVFGSIAITHNGPYGSLTAYLAEYDSELKLQGRTELKVRARAD
jgi:hypothetical protein